MSFNINNLFNNLANLLDKASNLKSNLGNLTNLFSKNETQNPNETDKTNSVGFWDWLGKPSTSTPRFNHASHGALRFQASNLNISEADVQASLVREAARYLVSSETAPPANTAPEKKLQTYNVTIPLADNRHKASYEQLSRRVFRTALEVNGIKPSNRELEELMSSLDTGGQIDFTGATAKGERVAATMATPQAIGTSNGQTVMGYELTLTPEFQQSVINDYKRVQAALAGKPEEKAVVDMSLNERMGEAIKIAYEKGYISQEVHRELSNLTPEELAVAFGLGGATALAAKTGARAALAPAGAVLFATELIKNGAELEVFGHACAKATTRAELEKPAAEFARWMGKLSKEGVLAITAAAGAKVAPSVMPKVTAQAEQFFTTTIKGAREAMRHTSEEVLLSPQLAAPEGVIIKTPQGKTPLEKINDPLEISKSEFDVLRKKSPSPVNQKQVNPDGPKIDPVYKYSVDVLEADHIVSLKEVTQMKDFDKLTYENQVEVVNLPENFMGLGKSTNSSKQAKSWSEWKGHSKLGDVPPDVRARMLGIEREARTAIEKAIQERLAKQDQQK